GLRHDHAAPPHHEAVGLCRPGAGRARLLRRRPGPDARGGELLILVAAVSALHGGGSSTPGPPPAPAPAAPRVAAGRRARGGAIAAQYARGGSGGASRSERPAWSGTPGASG